MSLIALTGAGCGESTSALKNRQPSSTAAGSTPALPPPAQPAGTALKVVPTLPTQVGTTEPGNPPQYTCVVTARPYETAASRPTMAALPTDPGAVDAVRIPGMNDRTCRSEVMTFGADRARGLALDLNRAPEPTPGVYSCPADDGTGIDLVFRYYQDPAELVVRIAATGCAATSGPDHVRVFSPALGTDLANLVPSAWLRSCVPFCHAQS